jgi:hypothetical protein
VYKMTGDCEDENEINWEDIVEEGDENENE